MTVETDNDAKTTEHNNLPQDFHAIISQQDFLARISHKNFLQDFPATISHKIFLQQFPTRFSREIFPQDFSTRFS